MTSTTHEKATVTAITKPRRSRASRGAAQAKAPANGKGTTVKRTAAKAPAKKTTAKKAPAAKKDTGPSERSQRQAVAALLVEAGAELIRTWNPSAHDGITKATALDAVRQSLGYVPAEAWSYTQPHKILGARTVGRPAPKSAK